MIDRVHKVAVLCSHHFEPHHFEPKHFNMKHFLNILLIMSSSVLVAQSISPQVIGSTGGSGTASGITVDWTVGEVAVTTISNGSNTISQGFHQGDEVKVELNVSAFLQGPYDTGSGLMNDGLRAGAHIPTTEPYTAMGFVHVGGGGESVDASVLAVAGNDAIVDWVFLDLRDKNDNTVVLATRSALLQRDGDIVDTDGTSSVSFQADADSYFVSVQHRNHLSIITPTALALTSTAITYDFTTGPSTTFGIEAQKNESGVYMMWSGDVSDDGVIKYIGADNDRDPILVSIGGSIPTATATGYLIEDVNMDGTTKYVGANNDRDPILVNVGGSVPTAIRTEQMP